MPWSAEEMLDGQHQRVDILDRARTADESLLQKSLEDDLWLNGPSCLPNEDGFFLTCEDWGENV